MKPGSLVIGWLHPGEVSTSFMLSMVRFQAYDLVNNQRLRGLIPEECGAARIQDGRNHVVEKFLRTDAEWLAFVDADMGFDADAFDQLIAVADKDERPIVGGLAFAQRKGPDTAAGARRFQSIPTIYQWVDDGAVAGCAPIADYPRDTLVKCDATGAAFFIAHRSVFEKLAEVFPQPRVWFDETIYKGQVFGEDITFFLRCKEHDIPLHVHTGVKTSHYKHVYLTEDTYQHPSTIPTFVVVPMKNRMDLTRRLLDDLEAQGGYERIFVFDNGSNQKTRNELDTMRRDRVTVVDADGWNIHQMWNRGLDMACAASWPCNVAVLNNDLHIGPDFLDGLAGPLRADPRLAVVSPNYDGRDGGGVEYVDDMCAGRYDGTGGLAGFAFMLKGEAGYRFPEELQWWFGDNDMLSHVLYAGSKAGIVRDVTVEHVDGGSQTGEWETDEMRDLLVKDRAWFDAKWGGIVKVQEAA